MRRGRTGEKKVREETKLRLWEGEELVLRGDDEEEEVCFSLTGLLPLLLELLLCSVLHLRGEHRTG